MNSIGKECDELKKVYEDCFNSWFSEKFLRGHRKDPCSELFTLYQNCVKKAMREQKIEVWEIEKDFLKTKDAKPNS